MAYSFCVVFFFHSWGGTKILWILYNVSYQTMSWLHQTPTVANSLECQFSHCALHNDSKSTLTQLSNAAHPRCEQRLLQRPELGLGVAVTLAAPPRTLLIPVQVQTLRQAQHTCRQHRGQKVKNRKAINVSSFGGDFSVFNFCWCQIKQWNI